VYQERAPVLRVRQAVKAVCQRVTRACVAVAGTTHAAIGPGLLVLLGVAREDDAAAADRLAAKVARLRVFDDDRGKFDRSVLDVGGSALVVSQFTLIADSKRQRGSRPDFSRAAARDDAERLYERFCEGLRDHGVPIETGVFGAYMAVELVNDGPVTVIVET
jgi:D-tyrosyl-tRNA(Tyr) deacylase